jgi:hypothetical protein
MTDEVPPDVAERRYERWVIRVADLVTGNYPEDKEEAEEMLLLRLDEGMIGRISPRRYFEPFAPEEMPEDPENLPFSEVAGIGSCSTRSRIYRPGGGCVGGASSLR